MFPKASAVKVGVIGVGALGRHHARLYQESPLAHLVGVYDANPETAARISAEFGIPAFDQIEDLAPLVEAFSVAVPTHLHFQVSEALLKAGKHLLIEKPITNNIDHARELIRLAEERGLVLAVGHVERFNPVVSYLEKRVDHPRFIESHRLAPYPPPRPGALPRGTEVGVVLDLMIHDIEMVLNLVKSPVVAVDAIGVPILSASEDIANARIRFENGCIANLTTSRVSPKPTRKIRLFQNDAYISLDYQAKAGEIYWKESGTIKMEAVPVEDHNALLKELEDFLSCIQASNQSGQLVSPKVSGQHGLRALELALQITASLEETTS